MGSKKRKNKSMILEHLNSRERRKIEAKNHNDLLIEREAYAEDKVRDPEKYRRKPSTKRSHLLPLIAIASTVGFSEL